MISVYSHHLSEGVSAVIGAVASSSSMPSLKHILMQPGEGDTIRLSATDLTITKQAIIPGTMEGEGIAVEAKRLQGLVKSLKKDVAVTGEASEGVFNIKHGKARIKLNALSADEYPEIREFTDNPRSFDIPIDDLRSMLVQIKQCAAIQDVRFYLTGVLVHSDGSKLHCVATDGRVLGHAFIDTELPEFKMILPPNSVTEIIKTQGQETATLTIAGKNETLPLGFKIDWGTVSLTSKVIEGQYPDWDRVVPKDNKITARINRDEFAAMLSRVSMLKDGHTFGVRFSIADGVMTALAINANREEAEDQIVVDSEHTLSEAAFSLEVLNAALSTCIGSEWFVWEFKDAGGASLLYGCESNTRAVVMPMRV